MKDAFHDQEFRESVQLGAVNSINWARVLAQMTYYFYSWFRVTDGLRSHGQSDLKVNYAVPTGNFGDILAGYYAKRMGLPIDKLVIATNSNDVLHRFMHTGEYRRQRTRATLAPSMDISVSSNFERYLYYLTNEDGQLLRTWMDEFENKGAVILPESCIQLARSEFLSWTAGKTEILATMRSVYEKHQHLICPHTATAVAAVRRLQMDPDRTVVLATAHPAKFEDALLLAVSNQVLPPRPDILMELFDLPVRRILLPPALDDIELFIKQKVFSQQNEKEEAAKQESAHITPRKYSPSLMVWWTTMSVMAAMATGAAFYWFRHKRLT